MKKAGVMKTGPSTEMEIYKGTSIEDALKALEAKEAILGKIHKEKYRTKGEVTLGSGRTVNIFEEKDPQILRMAYASVKARIIQLVDGDVDLIGIEGFATPVAAEVTVDGGNLEEWKNDFRLVILKNQTEARFKLIQSKREELKQYLDKEDRKKIILQEIANI